MPSCHNEIGHGEERVSDVDSSEARQNPEDCPAYGIIRSLSQARDIFCGYSQKDIKFLVSRPIHSTPLPKGSGTENPAPSSEIMDSLKICLWQEFARHATRYIWSVIEFIKRVPGLYDLYLEDQLILTKFGFYEIWMAHASRLSTDSTFSFADASFMTRKQMELIYSEAFVIDLFTFLSSFKSLSLGDTELALFSGLIVLSSDRPEISDAKIIQRHRKAVMEAFKLQARRSGLETERVLAKLSELRALSKKHACMLDWVKSRWDKLELPILFSELFNIPKCLEDLN